MAGASVDAVVESAAGVSVGVASEPAAVSYGAASWRTTTFLNG